MRANTNRYRMSALLALAAAALLVSSCSRQQTTTETQATNETPPPTTSTAPAMTDAEIAATVVAANDEDIANGRQAQGKSANREVKAFANMMITDHGSVNDKAKALVSQINLAPQPGATSQSIQSTQDSVRNTLKSMSGATFDKAYIANEVAYHEMVLNALDQTLIPNAQDPQLKQLLTETRPAVEQHLQHARELQAKLGGMASN